MLSWLEWPKIIVDVCSRQTMCVLVWLIVNSMLSLAIVSNLLKFHIFQLLCYTLVHIFRKFREKTVLSVGQPFIGFLNFLQKSLLVNHVFWLDIRTYGRSSQLEPSKSPHNPKNHINNKQQSWKRMKKSSAMGKRRRKTIKKKRDE